MVVVAKDTAMPEHGNLQVLVSQASEIKAMQGGYYSVRIFQL